ncbi:MAG: SpoIID/LytB domain-containing protein [Bacillota bacterium]
MKKHRPVTIIVLLLVTALIISSCARGGRQKSPLQEKYKAEPTISLYDNKTGEKKSIKLEEYLAGVVAAEMDPGWEVNALAAQAIVARTFTMENIESGRVREIHGTDASTSVEEFQAYDPARINDNVRKAVEMTRGEVATYNGQFIKGWFSACDGGVEASAKEGLSYEKTPTPYVRAGAKDGCLQITTPENRAWRAEIPLDKVRAAVNEVAGKDPGVIDSVKIVQKGPSGRVETLQLGSVQVGGPALRLALGSEQVRSTLIDSASIQGNKLILTGNGFGHGVGMCQWGARLMARNGKSPRDIVKFYFKDIEIAKLWQ